MIIWGGETGRSLQTLASGARYDPLTDAWSETSTVNAPERRAGHTALWTGDEMVVWGGLNANYSTSLGTGGRYDPLLDSWTPTSLAGAPSPRDGHSAVWTGNRMIVWGGFEDARDINTTLGDGASYDPAADAWTAVSTVSYPAARRDHSAVWTGDRMIVWGGNLGQGGVNIGGRYDPASDTWSPISTVNAPSPRWRHVAAWTGSEMIVWGGLDTLYSDSHDDGARYDPVADTWTRMSMTGAPSRRSAASGVWTGSQLIVWGGTFYGDELRTGGRYDPATDTWTPTTLAGAPEARGGHTAVWTGDRMIVWGGYGATTLLNSGGAYFP